MKKCNSFYIILALILSSFYFANGQDGEAIFKQNCAACHQLGQRLIGPDLIGVNEKRSESWLLKKYEALLSFGRPVIVLYYALL